MPEFSTWLQCETQLTKQVLGFHPRDLQSSSFNRNNKKRLHNNRVRLPEGKFGTRINNLRNAGRCQRRLLVDAMLSSHAFPNKQMRWLDFQRESAKITPKKLINEGLDEQLDSVVGRDVR